MVDDSSVDRDPVEVLAEEFVERLRRGERPSIAEYKSRYPNLADDIEDIFPALAMMDEIDPSAGELSQSEPAKDDILPKLEKLGDFRIIREVGRGGMGIVYEAEQVSLGRHVALKVLPAAALPDNKHVRRFEREAKSAAKLHHTNIVPVFGVGQQEELHYYVMQFIQGLPLDEVIDELKKIHARPTETITSSVPAERTGQFHRQQSVADVAHSLMTGQFAETQIGESDSDIESSADSSERSDSSASRSSETLNLSGSLSGSTLKIGKSGVHSAPSKIQTYWESVAHIGLQVADALQYAHEQNILHRDIKPSNLLLDLRGTTWVTDFGLAKATDQQDITHTGDILGTLRYMPPEAFDGIADARSDIYSLGLTLYELLAFQPAFGVKDRHHLIKQVTTETAPRLDKLNPQIPRDLVTIVHKAIDRDRSHRYQTAQEMQEDLQRFLEDEPIKARRISLTERLLRWSRRNKGLASSLATIVVLLLIINIAGPILYWQKDQQKQQIEEQNEFLARQKNELDESLAALKRTQENEERLYESNLAEERAKQQAIEGLLRAEQERANEREQKLIAQEKLERDIYVKHILQVAREAKRGNLARMREFLLAYIPIRKDEKDLRGPEWHYWWNFLNQSQEVWKRPAPDSISILPEGEFVAVAEGAKTQIIKRTNGTFGVDPDDPDSLAATLETALGNRIWRNPMTSAGLVVEHLSSARRMWTSSRDASLPESFRVFNRTGEVVREFEFPAGALARLFDLAISPDGRVVAALGLSAETAEDNSNPVCQLYVWSVETGELLCQPKHQGELSRLKMNHDGSLLVAHPTHGSQKGSDEERDVAVVFELIQNESQTEAKRLPAARHNDDIDSAYFLPDRRELLLSTLGFSGNQRKELYSWSLDEPQSLHRLGDEAMPDLQVGEISPDGKLFAVSSLDISTIRLIDTRTGKVVRTLYNSQGYKIGSLTFSADNRRLMAGGSTTDSAVVLQWDLESPDLFDLKSHPVTLAATNSLRTSSFYRPLYALSPDQSLLAHIDERGLMLRSRDEERESLVIDAIAERVSEGLVSGLAFSPDNRWLAMHYPKGAEHLQVRIYDTESRQEIFSEEIQRDRYGPAEMSFSTGGKLIIKNGMRLYAFDVNDTQPKRAAEYSLATGFSHLPVPTETIDRLSRGKFISHLISGPRAQQSMIAVLEPPQVMANVSEGQTSDERGSDAGGHWRLSVRDASSGATIDEISLPLDGDVEQIQEQLQLLVLAPDGRHVGVIWNSHIEVWPVQADEGVWTLSGNELVFSPDGSIMAVLSRDVDVDRNPLSRIFFGSRTRIETATLWDVATRTELSTISLRGTGTDEIRFAPNSQRLLTLHGYHPSSSADVAAEVRLWDIGSGHELLFLPVEQINHYFWDIAFDPAGDQLSSLTTLVLAKRSTGRDSSIAQFFDLSQMEMSREIELVARPLVDRLFEAYLLRDEVLSKLKSEEEYRPEILDRARILVNQAEDDLDAISRNCLKQIVDRFHQPDVDRYQRWAEAFQNGYPNDPRSRLIAGIAEFYSGNTNQALTLLASDETNAEPPETSYAPYQNLIRQIFFMLAQIRTEQPDLVEGEVLALCRILRRDLGFNYFTGATMELSPEFGALSRLFQSYGHVGNQLSQHLLSENSTPEQMAERILFVLDLDGDGVLTDADDSPAWKSKDDDDWKTLSRLDRNQDDRVMVEELAQLMSIATDGLNHPEARIVSDTRYLLRTPLDSYRWRNRASSWRDLKEYDRALADCDEAIRLASTAELQSNALNERGRVQLSLNEIQSAMNEFEAAIKLAPELSGPWNNLAICYARQGNDLKALEYYSKAIKLDPGLININNRARLYLKLGQHENAVKDFTELIRREPESATHYQRRGNAFLLLKEFDAAIEDFEKCLHLEPDKRAPLESIILAFTQAGDAEQAVTWFVKALESEPDAGKRIQIVERLSRLDLELKGIVDRRPDDPILLAALARQHSTRGDATVAAETLSRSQSLATSQLTETSEDGNAAKSLAAVLLATAEPATEWTALNMDDVTSAGGATLTRLKDGSILAGGASPDEEVYTVTVRPPHREITCLMLETFPDSSLPLAGTGRDPDGGNVVFTGFGLAVQDDPDSSEMRDIKLSRVASDLSENSNDANSLTENILGGGPGDFLSIWPDVHVPHRIIFQLEEPLVIPENGLLRITIASGDRKHGQPKRVLGRFRLSVSDAADAFEREQQRFDILKIEDGWEQLAAVNSISGRDDEQNELLKLGPKAALGLARYFLNAGKRAESLEALTNLDLPPDDAELIRLRAQLYVQLGELDRAIDDSLKIVQMEPTNSLHHLRAASLLVANGDEQELRKLCELAIKKFSDSESIGTAERLVKMCAFLPKEDPLYQQSAQIATTKVNPNPQNYVWAKMTSLLSAYRREEFKEALQRADECLALSNENSKPQLGGAYRNMKAFSYLIRAMSHHQLGQRDQAEQALEQGREICRGDLPQCPDLGWWDTFLSQALLREAETLINGDLQINRLFKRSRDSLTSAGELRLGALARRATSDTLRSTICDVRNSDWAPGSAFRYRGVQVGRSGFKTPLQSASTPIHSLRKPQSTSAPPKTTPGTSQDQSDPANGPKPSRAALHAEQQHSAFFRMQV